MHFRYKVTMINIAFLSVALGLLGFVIIHRNFRQALDIQITYALEENSLIQSSVEYQLLDIVNSDSKDFSYKLEDIGERTSYGILSHLSSFFIVWGKELSYSSNVDQETDAFPIPEGLLSSLELGEQNYMLCREQADYYIYAASKNIINQQDLYIVTKRNANDTYALLYSQIRYFIFLMLAAIVVCSFFFYFISQYLTKPMEQLNAVTEHFASGNYEIRATITSDDEIGMLAAKFNAMAASVSDHIEELNRMVEQHEQFVADFTHEIKTPMTTIIGYAQMLLQKNPEEKRRRIACQYIYSEGKRLETMSRKLFDLIYMKKNELVKSELSVKELAEEIRDSIQPILDRKEIVLDMKIEPFLLFGDNELLKTVFINLIDNARKASPACSHILFTGKASPDGYTFQVTDYGLGMDEETLSHVCDEFYMADKSRSREEGGAGLGMALVAVILQRHDAILNIESTLGHGTTVRVWFPADIL